MYRRSAVQARFRVFLKTGEYEMSEFDIIPFTYSMKQGLPCVISTQLFICLFSYIMTYYLLPFLCTLLTVCGF